MNTSPDGFISWPEDREPGRRYDPLDLDQAGTDRPNP